MLSIPMGILLNNMKKLKILAHFADGSHTVQRKLADTYGAIGYYRIVMPAKQVKDHTVHIVGQVKLKSFGKTLEEQWDNIFQQYDVFWTNSFSDDRIGAVIFYYAQKHGKKVILDVDDNYLDLPKTNKHYEDFKPKSRRRAIQGTVLSFADAITVSTYPLKERLWEHIKYMYDIDKPIYVIPNMNDVSFWKNKVKPKKDPKKVVIGYTGSNSHQDDLMMIMPVMSKLMTKYDNLHFQLLGSIERNKIEEHFNRFSKDALDRIDLGPVTPTFDEYPKWLAQQPWDIGIAPLVDTPFTRCKSHIKIMEYAMFKIPCVASRVYPYFTSIRGKQVSKDGETLLLARQQEWESKLTELIEDPELRNKLGENSYSFYKENWQYKDSDISSILNEMFSALF